MRQLKKTMEQLKKTMETWKKTMDKNEENQANHGQTNDNDGTGRPKKCQNNKKKSNLIPRSITLNQHDDNIQ